ncbi:AfsR/SARP family transcriptional regulator [Actinomadura atramentaria]|uniref:AfsR/SARP family transcriptional regulator n=1 Tax=Actinomadura atramentaria TaxID=1990 RepID=UPI00039BCC8D|nr:tetratricopeptide repeat protein [Actinomadura atramentaria]
MEFRILGPLELWAHGERQQLGWAKGRAVLAVLLLASGRPVRVEALIDRVWGPDAPPSARTSLHTEVSRLRRRLTALDGRPRVQNRDGAYSLDVAQAEIDYERYRRLREQARSAIADGDQRGALSLLREALLLWRGTPLQGIEGTWFDRMRRTIEDDLVDGALDRFKIELAQHDPAAVIPELDDLATRYPNREGFVRLLMLALHRAGRPADALQSYARLRDRLTAELGVDPSAETEELRRRIQNAAPARPAPARRAAARPPDDLPRDLDTFTGRDAELDRLTALAARPGAAAPVIAIDGMPGVGKTTLAVHLAHRLADRYPDGRIFLPLRAHAPDGAPVDRAYALMHLLVAIGVPEAAIQNEEAARLSLWRTETAARALLLVLDDAAGSDQVETLLPTGPRNLAVVTSRRRLAGLAAARPLSLDVLTDDEAVELLARASGRPLAAADPAVARVVRFCGGLPLALHLVGSRLLHRPGWAVDDLVDVLENSRDRLAEIRAENRELTAVFALSYDGLDDSRRLAFRLLGLHPGADMTPEDTAALLGVDRSAAVRTLEAFFDDHLLDTSRPGRYRFHDLVREYARDLAAADPPADAAALDRLTDHYLATAVEAERLLRPDGDRADPLPGTTTSPAFPDAAAAARWMDAEMDNLILAARAAAARGSRDRAVRFAAVLAPRLESAGRWRDGIALHETAVALCRESGDDAGVVRASVGHSKFAWRMGESRDAISIASKALGLAESMHDDKSCGDLLKQIGLVHWHLSEYDVASGYLEQALDRFRRCGDAEGEAEALNTSGIVYWHQGRYADADARLHAALDLYIRLGNRRGQQIVLNNFGDVQKEFGNYDAALSYFLQAKTLVEMRRQHLGIWLNNVASVYQKKGQHAQAVEHYREALVIYGEIGDRRSESDALTNIGECLAELGRDGEALIHQQKALALARELADRFVEARALSGIAETNLRAGRLPTALEYFERSLDLARTTADVRQEARALAGLADALARTGGAAAAEPYWRRACELLAGLGVMDEVETLRARFEGPSGASGA